VGAKHVSVADVEAAAAIEGENLLLVSADEVTARVERLPWVAAAKVDRRLPGTVRIKIDERAAAIALDLSGRRWTLDPRGHVLERGAESRLPVVVGVPASEPVAGERVTSPEALAALTVWRSLRALRADVQVIFAPSIERISLSLTGGTTVRYGAAEAVRAKRAVLRVLLARLRGEGTVPEYVDVRVPANPAVGPPLVTAPTGDATPTPVTEPSSTTDAGT
jgi:cell division protein FtsQ